MPLPPTAIPAHLETAFAAESDPVSISFDCNGFRLGAWDHGGPGPVVLAVHGFLDTARSFDALAAALRGTARVIAVDLRGHGTSRPLPPGASAHLLDHLKDLRHVVETLLERDQKPEMIVAHSMGGNVALLLAGARPELVTRLLMLDALGAPAEEAEDQPRRLRQLLTYPVPKRDFSPADDVVSAIDRVRRSAAGLSERGACRVLRHSLELRDDGKFHFPYDAGLRGPAPTRWPESFWLSLCSQVSAPCVVLRAENGYVPADERVDQRVAALNGALVTLEGVGHNLHVDAVDEVALHARALLLKETPPVGAVAGEGNRQT